MNKKKVLIGVGIVVLLLAIVGFTVTQSNKGVISVQTGKVEKGDLASTVTASGEIKPKTFANIGALSMGQIVRIYVHEGEVVKKGQKLVLLDNIQSKADVAAMAAQLDAAKTDAAANSAALRSANAELDRAQADYDRAKLDYARAEKLFAGQLIPKSQYDQAKNTYDAAAATIDTDKAHIAQAKATLSSSNERIRRRIRRPRPRLTGAGNHPK